MLFGSVFFMGVGLAFAKLLGLTKEVLLANYFGISSNYENFLIAFVYVGAPVSILISSYQTAFITRLAKVKSAKLKQDLIFGSVLFAVFSTLSLMFIWILLLNNFGYLLFGDFEIIKSYIIILIPLVVFNAINLILYGVMQVNRRFLLNGILPSVSNILVIITVAVMSFFSVGMKVEPIIYSLIIASFMELIILIKITHFKFGCNRLTFLGVNRILVPASFYFMLTAVLTTFSPMIEQYISSNLFENGVVLLKLSSSIPVAISGLIITTVAVVILPYFSKLSRNNSIDIVIREYFKLFTLYLVVCGLGLSIVAIFSFEIVSFLYRADNIGAEQIETISLMFKYYCLFSFFYCLLMFTSRFLCSIDRGKTVFYMTLISFIIQVSFLFLGSGYLSVEVVPYSLIISSLLAVVLLNLYIFRVGYEESTLV